MLVDTATGDATIFPAQYADLCDVAPSGRVIGRYGLYEDSWSIWSSTGDKVDEQRAMKSCGSFSPDGRYAVGTRYRSDADSRIDVVVYDFQTKTQRNLTNGTFGGYNAYPTWSPTGEWIIWGSNKDRSGSTGFGATDLWRIRPDGTDAKKIVDGTKFGSAGTGFMNFEAPDVQPVRGFAPEPEPTREELRARRRRRPRPSAPRARRSSSTPRPRRRARTAPRSAATPGTSTATAPTTTPPAPRRRRASPTRAPTPSPCR